MATDWFPLWLERHLDRHSLDGLPDPNKSRVFYETWRDEFERRHVKHEHAEMASKLLAAKKHYKSAHFPELMFLISEVRRAASGSPAEEAKAASANCPDCSGEGLTSVPCTIIGLHKDQDVRGSFAVFCVCRIGRLKLGAADKVKKPSQQLLDLANIRRGITYQALIHGKAVTLVFDGGDRASRNREDDHADRLQPQARGR